MWFEIGLLCALLLGYLWVTRPKRPPNFPPGPPTFLIFGNLPTLTRSLSDRFLDVFKDLRNKYNKDIVGLVDPFGKPLVHIFNADLIKEACNKVEVSGRPWLFQVVYMSDMKRVGIFFTEGPMWQEHRRFALKHLRDFGLGKGILNTVIAEEYCKFSQHLGKQVGKEVKANNIFITTALNIIWKMVASQRFDYDDPERLKLKTLVESFSRIIGPQNILTFFPSARFVAPEASGFNTIVRYRQEAHGMFSRVVEEHRRTLDPQNPRDFVDAFLIEMGKPDAAARGFDDLNLTAIGMDFFLAGSETTSTSMTWAMLLMCVHPDVQTKVQEELDSVLGEPGEHTMPGTARHPSYGDREFLPFTEAVMTEVMRYISFVPLAAPHQTLSGPVELAGYTLPKDCTVVPHLHAAHHDRDHWGDPEVFRPERFIGKDGKFRKDDFFIPFGVGKRACIGESLARMEFFVFFGCLFQEFRLRLPDGAPKPSMDAPFGVFLQPADFSVILERRAGKASV